MSPQPYRPFTPPAPPPWVVHPCACGACGTKRLTARGLGPCSWCSWSKPAIERAELARRLEANPEIARRLDREAA